MLTVHDMTQEILPEFANDRAIKRMKALSIERADHLICVSNNTKKDLIEILGVEESKISVIPLGTDFQRVAPNKSLGPYLLFVGPRNSYKNFDRLLMAYSSSEYLKRNVKLMCFGGSRFSQGEIRRIEALGLKMKNVSWVSGDDRALAMFYSGAALLAFPSRYEGFGIPLLEAMACGCPVVCSNRSSLPKLQVKQAPISIPKTRKALGPRWKRPLAELRRRKQESPRACVARHTSRGTDVRLKQASYISQCCEKRIQLISDVEQPLHTHEHHYCRTKYECEPDSDKGNGVPVGSARCCETYAPV